MAKIFLSTTEKDAPRVEPLFRLLSAYEVYWYVKRPFEAHVRDRLRSEMEGADLVLAALSSATQLRNWIEEEILCAIALGKPLLAATLDDDPFVPRVFVGRKNCELFDFREKSDLLLKRLAEVLSSAAARDEVVSHQRSAAGSELVHFNPLHHDREVLSWDGGGPMVVPAPTRIFHISVFEAHKPPLDGLIRLLEVNRDEPIFALKWIWHLIERRTTDWSADHRDRLARIVSGLKRTPSTWLARPDEVAIEIGTISSSLSLDDPFTKEHWTRMRGADYASRHADWLLRYYGNPRATIEAMVRHTNRESSSSIYIANELVCAAQVVQRVCRLWGNEKLERLDRLFGGYANGDELAIARALVGAYARARATLDGQDMKWFERNAGPIQRLEAQI